MLKIRYAKSFKKDYKRIIKRGYDAALLKIVLEQLVQEKSLPESYKDHQLSGKYAKFRECHITPDWLLIYQINNHELILTLMRTGTHSDLF
jgi:addiction module toxin, relE/stbE family